MEFEKALLLAALTITTWVILALLAERRGDPRLNRPLAALLLSLCVPLAYFYTLTLESGAVAWLGPLALAGLWIKGPLLRLLTGAAVAAPLRSPLWHFSPFAVACVVMPLLPQAGQLLGLAGLIHALSYQIVSIHLLIKHRARLARIYQGYPNSAFYWLLYVLAGLAMIMVFDFLLMGPGLAYGSLPLTAIKISTLLTTGYMLGIALCSLYRPQLFFGLTEKKAADLASTGAEAETNSVEPTRIARELTMDAAKQLSGQLRTLMTTQQLYLDSDLSLASLAGALDATPHQTSELLNTHMGLSFYDYINELRITYAADRLRETNCKMRIIDIAYQAGFNNKNSFYRLFRQRFAVTPAAYRAEQTNQALKESASIESDQRAETLN